jgi:hypothetical protein
MPATKTRNQTSEIAILGRLLSNGNEPMPRPLARYILDLGFTDLEKAHMTNLATRNQEGTLSAAERDELLAYANAGCLLGILQSKARKSLKKRKKP